MDDCQRTGLDQASQEVALGTGSRVLEQNPDTSISHRRKDLSQFCDAILLGWASLPPSLSAVLLFTSTEVAAAWKISG